MRWHPYATALRERVSATGIDHGIEFSIKIISGELWAQRFLLLMHKDVLQPDPHQRVRSVLGSLSRPKAVDCFMNAYLDDAKYVHLGYEQAAQKPICKLYCEFPGGYDSAGNSGDWLVHKAIKWPLDQSDEVVITDYRGSAGHTVETIAQCMQGCFTELPESPVLKFCLDLLALAEQATAAENLFLLDVTEADNPRHSFDLNVYQAELTLDSILPLLPPMLESQGIQPTQARQLFGSLLPQSLGHISAGLDRSMQPFCTLYYGVRPGASMPVLY